MSSRWLSLPVERVLPLLVGGAIFVFLITALFGLFNPRDTSQPEGAVVAAALRWANGEPLYLDIRKGPYVTAMYGPFLYAVMGAMVRVTGAGVEGAYRLGRLLSLASAMGCGFLIASLARRYGASARAAGIAGGLFLASPVILPVAYSARSDVPAVVLGLSGVALFARWSESAWRYLAAAPLVAALYTKQTALAGTLAIVLTLALARRRAQAALFLAAVIVPAAVILVVLNRATGGLAALNLLEVPGASPLSLVGRPLGSLATFLFLGALPLVLAATVLPRAAADPKLKLPAVYAGTALLASLAASTKLGSDSYYFMEPLAAFLVLGAVGITRILEADGRRLGDPLGAAVAGLFVVLLGASVGMMGRMGEFRYQSNREIIRLAASVPGDVLVEDENVALKCGKPVTMMDAFAFAYLERRGRWDSQPLNRRIEERDFSLIVLRSPIEHPSHYQGENYWSDSTLSAIGRSYRMDSTVDGFYVYRPRIGAESARGEGRS